MRKEGEGDRWRRREGEGDIRKERRDRKKGGGVHKAKLRARGRMGEQGEDRGGGERGREGYVT